MTFSLQSRGGYLSYVGDPVSHFLMTPIIDLFWNPSAAYRPILDTDSDLLLNIFDLLSILIV